MKTFQGRWTHLQQYHERARVELSVIVAKIAIVVDHNFSVAVGGRATFITIFSVYVCECCLGTEPNRPLRISFKFVSSFIKSHWSKFDFWWSCNVLKLDTGIFGEYGLRRWIQLISIAGIFRICWLRRNIFYFIILSLLKKSIISKISEYRAVWKVLWNFLNYTKIRLKND